jgi:hypothetical protein
VVFYRDSGCLQKPSGIQELRELPLIVIEVGIAEFVTRELP